jgi:hypothetical protein
MLTRARTMNLNYYIIQFSFCSRLTGGYLTKNIVHTENCTLQTCVPIGLDTINAIGRGDFIVPTNYEVPFCGKLIGIYR